MSGYRVLIVDDDEATHDVVGTYLRLAGFRIAGCRDGAEVKQAASELRPDLILLDIQMPVLHGFDTLKVLRADAALRNIPVLFLSSLRREDLKVKALELGAEDYITKPYSKPELLARIRAALRRSHRYTRSEGVMSGSLADIGLATLMQTLELGRKSGVIDIAEMDCQIVFCAGALGKVQFGTFRGAAALSRAALINAGEFAVSLTEPDAQQVSDSRTMAGALLRAMQSVDEALRIGAEVLKGNPLLEVGSTLAPYPHLAVLAPLSPVSAYTLVTQMAGTIEENATEMRRAFEDSMLATFGGQRPARET